MTPEKRTRLIQLLGMIGSSHDGEALNAARLAQRLLGSEGLTWEEAMNGHGGGYTEEAVRTVVTEAYDKGFQDGITKALKENPLGPPQPVRTWQSYARELKDDYDDYLSEWERGFVESFIDRGWPSPTPKQHAIFERISRKTGTALP